MFNIKLSIERKIKQLKRQQALRALSKSPSIDVTNGFNSIHDGVRGQLGQGIAACLEDKWKTRLPGGGQF